MKKKVMTLITILILSLVSACSTSSVASDTGAAVETVESEQQSSQISPESTTITQVTNQSQSVSTSLRLETHEDDADYTWDAAAETVITFNRSTILADGVGVDISGSTASITSPGTYRLKGSLEDGQLVVHTENEGVIRLIADNLSLSNSSGPAIYVENAEKVVLILADGSQNSLSDGANYALSSSEEDQPNAALFSKDDLTIYGSGSLTVEGNSSDAIISKDGLIIRNATMTITAVDDGIRGKNYLTLQDSTLSLTTGGDGLKSDSEDAKQPGTIVVSNSNVSINSTGDAISAMGQVEINSGTFRLQTKAGSAQWSTDGVSAKGIKGVLSVEIHGGEFSIDSADDAIHSNGSITIDGGDYTIASGDDGAHADAALVIDDGNLRINKSYEGLESAIITINGGTIHITSSDDGINVSGGVDASGTRGSDKQPPNGEQPGGGRPPMDGLTPGGNGTGDYFAQTGTSWLTITGGYVYVNAAGDGLDVNGSAEISGGTILVDGPTENMNGSLDYLGTFTVTGGLLIALGSAGMVQAPSETSSQPSVVIVFESIQKANSLITFQSTHGGEAISYSPAKDYQAFVISSPDLVAGTEYDVLLGGSPTGEAMNGLYTGGTALEGDLYTTITLASTVTTVGTVRGMGGFGEPGKRP